MNPLSDSCAKVDELLLDYAYGELEGTPLREVETHLEGCARCREQLEQLGSVRTAMAGLPQVPAPEQGTESLLDYARRAAERRPPARRAWRWLVAAVPVGGLVAVVFLAVSQVGGPAAMMSPAAVRSDDGAPAPVSPAQRAAAPVALPAAEPAMGAPPAAPARTIADRGQVAGLAEGFGAADVASEAAHPTPSKRVRSAKKDAPAFAGRAVAEAERREEADFDRAAKAKKPAPAPARPSARAYSAFSEAPAAPEAAAPREEAPSGGAERAERKAERAVRQVPEDGAQGLLEALASRRQAGDWSGALRLCEQFVSAHPDHTQAPAVQLERAQLLERLGRPAEARRVQEALVRSYPGSSEAARAREALR